MRSNAGTLRLIQQFVFTVWVTSVFLFGDFEVTPVCSRRDSLIASRADGVG